MCAHAFTSVTWNLHTPALGVCPGSVPPLSARTLLCCLLRCKELEGRHLHCADSLVSPSRQCLPVTVCCLVIGGSQDFLSRFLWRWWWPQSGGSMVPGQAVWFGQLWAASGGERGVPAPPASVEGGVLVCCRGDSSGSWCGSEGQVLRQPRRPPSWAPGDFAL